MPLTLKITEGVLPPELEQKVVADLCNAFLEVNGAASNSFMVPNFPAIVYTLPAGKTYTAGKLATICQVELRVPSFAATKLDEYQAWTTAATNIIEGAGGGRIKREHIWVNMVYGAGKWGVGGTAYTDETLKQKLESVNV